MAREFRIARQVELPASLDEVWQAIATGPGVAAWFMPTEIDPDGPDVAEWTPPHRLAIRGPAAADGSTHAFEYLVEGRDGGTSVLRFVHSGVLGDDWDDEYEGMTGSGWDMYLFTLAQYLRHFGGRPASYAQAQAPVVGGWDRLLARLGPVRRGGPLRVELPGGPVLVGEVDYLAEKFIGMRTADGLIRFHERSAIGLPIAVSDHHYGAPADPSRAESWRQWLAAAVDRGDPAMTDISPQKLTTFLMFEGRAEEAMTLYTSLFDDSEIVHVSRYGPNEQGAEGSVRQATFALAGQQFTRIDSYVAHPFTFTPAASIYVRCADRAELDRLDAELSKDGTELMPPDNYGFSTHFTWLNDKFGVSWQLNLD